MRVRLKTLAAAGLLLAALALLPMVLRALPVAPRSLGPRRDGGSWRGILTVWLVETWRPAAGSHSAWLMAQARSFEKASDGVLLHIDSVSPQAAVLALEGVEAAPDIVIWGSGVPWVQPERFADLAPIGEDVLPEALLEACAMPDGEGYRAVPLTMGGYALLINADAAQAQGLSPDAAGLRGALASTGKGKMGWNAPLPGYTGRIAPLVSAWGLAASGLPPEGLREDAVMAWPAFALDAGTLGYIGTQREASRLTALAASGKTFAWAAVASRAYTDQLLLFSRAPRARHLDATEYAARTSMVEAWLAHLLSQPAQADLARIGAFRAVPGEPLYHEGAMALIETALQTPQPAALWVLPEQNAALRKALKACRSAHEAFELLRLP